MVQVLTKAVRPKPVDGLTGNFDTLSPNGIKLGLLVRPAHGSNELKNLYGVFDALLGLTLSV